MGQLEHLLSEGWLFAAEKRYHSAASNLCHGDILAFRDSQQGLVGALVKVDSHPSRLPSASWPSHALQFIAALNCMQRERATNDVSVGGRLRLRANCVTELFFKRPSRSVRVSNQVARHPATDRRTRSLTQRSGEVEGGNRHFGGLWDRATGGIARRARQAEHPRPQRLLAKQHAVPQQPRQRQFLAERERHALPKIGVI